MKYKLFFILIFLIAFVLRFYKLGEIPLGFYQDESAIGYNAYSIVETGKDEYGKKLPVYFKSFGDYKLPVYIYSTIIPIKIFGLNEFAVRFPSAFFGLLSVAIFYFFVFEITKEKKLALVSSFLLSINPWSLDYNRATFEVSISLFFFLLGGLLLLKAFNKKFVGGFILGTICFVISFYSYNLTRLLAPVLYVLILSFNSKKLKELGKKEIVLTGIISLILIIPFVKTLFGNGGVSSASGTLIFSSASVLAPLTEIRSYFVGLPTLLSKLLFNNMDLVLWHYLENIVSYFSTSFFFVSGSSHGNHGIGNFGQFYIFEFFFIIVALVKGIREKIKYFNFFLLWGLVVILIASLTRDVPHATRSFFLIAPFEVLSALGFIEIINWIFVKKKVYRILFLTFLSLFIFYNMSYYFASYYIRFPILYAKAWRLEDKNLSLYIRENESKYSRVVFDDKSGFMYTSLLFYLKYSPSEFQKTVIREKDDSEGFSKVKSFGKYEFNDINSNYYQPGEKILFITSPDKKPDNSTYLETFYYPKRPIVFSVGQNIMQYPEQETAYAVFEKK